MDLAEQGMHLGRFRQAQRLRHRASHQNLREHAFEPHGYLGPLGVIRVDVEAMQLTQRVKITHKQDLLNGIPWGCCRDCGSVS
jgi:hypothetical protein